MTSFAMHKTEVERLLETMNNLHARNIVVYSSGKIEIVGDRGIYDFDGGEIK